MPPHLRLSQLTQRQISLFVFFIIAGMALLNVLPVLSLDSWYRALQAYRYPYLLDDFYEAFKQGFLYPRWMPDLMGGYGYPTFVFYQPGVFFYFLLFRFFSPDVLFAVKAGLLCMFALGGLGVYRLARLYCRPLFAAACVVPYLSMQQFSGILNEYGNYSELFAALLCPWVLYYTLRLSRDIAHRVPIRNTLFGLTGFSALLIASHPFVTYFFMPTACVIALGLLWEMEKQHRQHFIVAFGACMIIALAVTSPYWFTIWQMKDEVRYQRQFEEFYIIGLNSFYTGFFQPSHPLYHPFTGNPYFWIYYFVVAAIGYALAIERKWKAMGVAAVCILVLSFFTTKHSIWFWYHIPGLQFSQFPRRMVSGLTALIMLGYILSVARMDEAHAKSGSARYKYGMLALLAALILIPAATLVNAVPGKKPRFYTTHEPLKPMNYTVFTRWTDNRMSDMTHSHEFFPVHIREFTVKHRRKEDIPVAEALSRHLSLRLHEEATDHRIRFTATPAPRALRVRNMQKPLSLQINQFYVKGWKIEANGSDVPFIAPGGPLDVLPSYTVDKTGRMVMYLPREKESYDISAWYDGPPGWQYRNLLIFATVLSCAWLVRRQFIAHGRPL